MQYAAPRWALASFLVFSLHVATADPLVTIGQNFTGAVFGKDSVATPADSNGEVGPQHFVQLVNGNFSVFDKSTGTLLQTMTDLEFWTNAGVVLSASLDVSDPRVIFDQKSERWFASMIEVNVNLQRQRANHFLVAVSENADPTKVWHAVSITADPVHGYFADFPTLGLDANGVYLSGDLFNRFGNSVGPVVYGFSKGGLLSNPIELTGINSSGLLSYSDRGQILQPCVTTGNPSSSEILLAVGDLGLDLLAHHTLVGSTIQNITNGTLLNAPITVDVPSYTIPFNPFQPSGSDNLDDGDARISAAVRRVGDLLYAVHAVETNNRAAIRWYKLDAITGALLQSGTITSTNLDFFYPSIAANASGTVVIACNGSSAKVFVSCYAIVGETSAGVLTFGSPRLLKSGLASYDLHDPSGTSRWGDYSATTPDPSDQSRFWTIQMYPVNSTTWATQITELIVGTPELRIARADQTIQISWPVSSGFRLQYTTDLSAPVWLPVPQPPTVLGGLMTVSAPLNNNAAFFRLAD